MKWKRMIGWALAGLLTVLLIAAVAGYFIYWSLSRRGWETLSGASDSAD